jgi:hypothetical protein
MDRPGAWALGCCAALLTQHHSVSGFCAPHWYESGSGCRWSGRYNSALQAHYQPITGLSAPHRLQAFRGWALVCSADLLPRIPSYLPSADQRRIAARRRRLAADSSGM